VDSLLDGKMHMPDATASCTPSVGGIDALQGITVDTGGGDLVL